MSLNRVRHLYSAGLPSRWALAHILVFFCFWCHVAINFSINLIFYNFSRVDVCHICSRWLVVYQLGCNISVSSWKKVLHLCFQQFGPIIDVEIIFNERGSKVLVCVLKKLLRSWRSLSGRQQIIWLIIDVALGRPMELFYSVGVQANCLWTCFHFVLINRCSDKTKWKQVHKQFAWTPTL